MQADVAKVNTGLEGVVVAASAISHVDGEAGDLSYRGTSIHRWVEQEFAKVAGAVLDWNSLGLEKDLAARLYDLGKLSDRETQLLLENSERHPMAVLQGLVPLLAFELAQESKQLEDVLLGITVAARLPHAVATLIAGEAVTYPAEPDYSTRFLKMLGHDKPTAGQRRALSVTQILQLEHSLNAGTFAARVTASTQASMPAAISSALGALSGVLHGGADQAAMEMADEVGDPGNAAAFVDELLARGQKLMGMGHREYKVMDPRAVYVKKLAAELAQGSKHEKTYATLCAVEDAFAGEMAARNKPIHPNLEFYKGLVYRALGVPDRAFTAAFAMARVFGYIAHVLESRVDGRIIRPAALYTGTP